jgi:hypothetical protein
MADNSKRPGAGTVTALRPRPVRQSVGPALTRVSVEHRGWEKLTEEQLARDCALPGGYVDGAYVEGWARILGRLAAAAGGQP